MSAKPQVLPYQPNYCKWPAWSNMTALFFFLVFTGCDTCSCFFGKGKRGLGRLGWASLRLIVWCYNRYEMSYFISFSLKACFQSSICSRSLSTFDVQRHFDTLPNTQVLQVTTPQFLAIERYTILMYDKTSTDLTENDALLTLFSQKKCAIEKSYSLQLVIQILMYY